jgi:hypothetical protein
LVLLVLGTESIGARRQRRTGLCAELRGPAIGRMFEAMDDKQQQQREKIFAAMCEAAAIARQHRMLIDEAMQFLVDYLAGHEDADVREFQRWYELHVRRDLN